MATEYDPVSGLPIIPDDHTRWDFPDVAKSFGSGFVNGGSALLSLPGDLKQMIATAHDQYVRPIEQRLGYQGPSPETMQQIYAEQPSLTPRTEQIARLTEALLGPPHQPQTEVGGLAYKVGEKLPGLPLLLLMRGR